MAEAIARDDARDAAGGARSCGRGAAPARRAPGTRARSRARCCCGCWPAASAAPTCTSWRASCRRTARPSCPATRSSAEVVGARARAPSCVAPGGEPGAPPLARRRPRRRAVAAPDRSRPAASAARGRENLCEHALFTGWDVDGGFAEYTLAPAGFVYRLPAGMDGLAAAPLLCAGIIGYRCLRLVGIVGDDAGLPGGLRRQEPQRWPDWPPTDEPHEASRSASSSTASARPPRSARRSRIWRGWEVYGIARDEEHRAMARELGAVVGRRDRRRPRRAATTPPSSSRRPASSPSTPCAAPTRAASSRWAGSTRSPIPPIEYPWIYHERVVRSVANSTRRDARELLRDAAAIPIVSRVQEYDLEQANEALLDLKEDRVRGSAVFASVEDRQRGGLPVCASSSSIDGTHADSPGCGRIPRADRRRSPCGGPLRRRWRETATSIVPGRHGIEDEQRYSGSAAVPRLRARRPRTEPVKMGQGPPATKSRSPHCVHAVTRC